jgi:hypothetical protein
MKITCDCGNEMVFNEINEDTGEKNDYTDGEGLYVTVDHSKFSFWQQHDVVGTVCNQCDKDIWLFT